MASCCRCLAVGPSRAPVVLQNSHLAFSVKRFDKIAPGRRAVRSSVASVVVDVALTGQQAGLVASVLKPALSVFEVLMIVRIVMSWDPKLNTDKQLPWSIAYIPTEPILAPTRNVIKPIGGVDISPIIWTFISSLLSEILLGPQGILIMIERQGGL